MQINFLISFNSTVKIVKRTAQNDRQEHLCDLENQPQGRLDTY